MTDQSQQTTQSTGVAALSTFLALVDTLSKAFKGADGKLAVPSWFDFQASDAYAAVRDSITDFTRRFTQKDWTAMIDELEKQLAVIDAKAPTFLELSPEDQTASMALDGLLLRLRGKQVAIAFDRAWWDWLVSNIFPLIEKVIPTVLALAKVAAVA